jgi:hypothetical protein
VLARPALDDFFGSTSSSAVRAKRRTNPISSVEDIGADSFSGSHSGKSLNPPSFSIIACMERPTNASCFAVSLSNVRQRIHFGFSPPPFRMPGSQPSRARSLSAAANYSDAFVRAFIARNSPEISRRPSIASAA